MKARLKQSLKRLSTGVVSLSFMTLALICCSAVTSLAQRTSPERGFNPGNSYSISNIETISLQSGNLMLNLPLGSLPAGRGGMSADVSLRYNSKLWDMLVTDVGGSSQNLLDPSQDGGWQYGYEYALEVTCSSGYKVQLIMPDGSRHLLVLPGYTAADGSVQSAPGGSNCGGSPSQQPVGSTLTYSTIDGTYLRLDVLGDGDANPANNTWILYFPGGKRLVHNPQPGSNILQRIIDRNGNYIDFIENATDAAYNGHRTTYLKDQLNRKIVIEYGAAANEDWIHSSGFGAELISRVIWRNINVRRTYVNCLQSCAGSRYTTTSQTFRVVDKVYLPAQLGNLSYSFDYNADATSNPSTGWGEVSRVTLPSGAYSTYTYAYDNSPDSMQPFQLVNNRPQQKTLNYKREYDGAEEWTSELWTYASGPGGALANPTWANITGPDGAVTTEYYDYATGVPPAGYAQQQVAVKAENADGSIVEKYYQYNVPADAATLWAANSYVKYEFVSLRDAAHNPVKTAIKDYSYDKNGNVTRVAEYDFVDYATVPRNAAGRPAGLPSGITPKRISVTDNWNAAPDAAAADYTNQNIYALTSSPGLRALAKSVEVKDGTGTVMSRTEMSYDNISTTGNLTGLSKWDSSKGAYSNPLSQGNSISISYQYDQYGNVTLTTDARQIQTKYTYGPINGYADLYPTQTETAYGSNVKRTTAQEYDFPTGLVTRATDVDNNVAAETGYDSVGRAVLTKTAVGTPLEAWARAEYDDVARRVIARADLYVKGDGKRVAIQHFDQLGRVRLTRTLEDAANQSATLETDGIKVQTRYLATNSGGTGYSYQLTSNPYRANYASNATAEQTMGWARSKADNTGRHTEVETFAGASLPAPWGGNATSTGKVATEDEANSVTVTDQWGKARKSVTDALGRLTAVYEDPAGANYLTSYAYDVMGNLRTVTQGAQTRTFVYDSLSRLTSATNPESGTIQYQYDANGNLVLKIDPRTRPANPPAFVCPISYTGSNIATCYDYDALNRLKSRTYNDGTPNVTYTYDTLPNGKGRLSAVSSSVSTTSYDSYDLMGRVTASTQTTDGQSYTLPQYVYDLSGHLIAETYPSGRVVTTGYDSAGRLNSVTGQVSAGQQAKPYADSASYWASGAMKDLRLGNQLWEHAQLNTRLQPIEIDLGTQPGGIDRLKLNYDYGATDNNGDVRSHSITVASIGTASGFTATQSYGYDGVNRLTSAREVSSSGLEVWKQSYSYGTDGQGSNSQYGNRRVATGNDPQTGQALTSANVLPSSNPTINPLNNRFDANQGYGYDEAGNVTAAPNQSFTYDAENHQTSLNVTGTTYSYDGDGRRVKKIESSGKTVFVYDVQGQMVAEYRDQLEPGGVGTSFLTSDTLGTPRIMTGTNINDAKGGVLARHDYLPFGEEIGDGMGGRIGPGHRDGQGNAIPDQGYVYGSGLFDNLRQKFTGKERDGESGLDYFEARYYANPQGRFTSPDPLLSSGTIYDPQTWNRYSYSLNNPTKYTDPSGLFVWDSSLGGSASDSDLNKTEEGRRMVAKRNEFRIAFGKAAFAVLSSTLADAQKGEIMRSLQAYGTEGEQNGVTVATGKVPEGAAAKTGAVKDAKGVPDYMTNDKNGNVIAKVTVTFSGTITADSVAHEGSHVGDWQDFVAAVIKTSIATPLTNEQINSFPLNVTKYATEFRAYQVSSAINQAQDVATDVWNRGWSEADRTSHINTLLRTDKLYKVTPEGTKPGPGSRLVTYGTKN